MKDPLLHTLPSPPAPTTPVILNEAHFSGVKDPLFNTHVSHITPFRPITHYASAVHQGYYFTYIVASKSRTLYIGVTGDLLRRVFQHKEKTHPGFSARYNCQRLVWFERSVSIENAIHREKELKGWTRSKKITLIQAANPTWEDLSADWYAPQPSPPSH